MQKVIPHITRVFLLGAIWGAGFTIARFAVTNGVKPLGYAFWQSFGPMLLLFLILRWRRQKISATPSYLRFYLICGVLGIAIPNTNMYFVAQHLPAGVLAIIINTSSLLIYLLALLMRAENFSWRRLLGVIIAFIGVLIILLPRVTGMANNNFWWLLLALLTPLCFALCAIYIIKHEPADSNVLLSAFGMLLVSSIILVPIVYVTKGFYSLTLKFTLPELAILLEIVLSTVGYLLLFKILRSAGAVYYSFVGPVVVVAGVFWGWLIFREQFNYLVYFSALAVTVGLVLVARSKSSSV